MKNVKGFILFETMLMSFISSILIWQILSFINLYYTFELKHVKNFNFLKESVYLIERIVSEIQTSYLDSNADFKIDNLHSCIIFKYSDASTLGFKLKNKILYSITSALNCNDKKGFRSITDINEIIIDELKFKVYKNILMIEFKTRSSLNNKQLTFTRSLVNYEK